jgi:hypothetical protein
MVNVRNGMSTICRPDSFTAECRVMNGAEDSA